MAQGGQAGGDRDTGFRADFVSQVLATVSREPPDRPVRRVADRAYAQALASAVRRVPAGYRVSRSA